MKTILIVMLLSFVSSNSFASYERSEQLLWACNGEPTNPKEAFRKMHCMGYVSGIIDGMRLIFGVKPDSRFFCLPKQGISTDQTIKIISKYLENKPEELNKSSRMTALIALMKAFPCK